MWKNSWPTQLIWLFMLSMVVGGVAILLTTVIPNTSKASQAEPLSHSIYFPFVVQQSSLSWRLGYGVTQTPLTRYPELDSLHAGWYVDWGINIHPALLNGIEYVQTIRVHQKLACGVSHHSDRNACPYAQPLDYVYSPDAATIVAAVQTNPGSLWLIGNEMDRIDWAYCAVWAGTICQQVVYDGQDEILPETYATVYHTLYTLIKQTDPTAKLAIGGVIQPTPLRLAYITKIWDSYQTQYGATMPVDVWNIHNFIIQEKAHEYGADIPPGVNAAEGNYINALKTHIDLKIFAQQIHDFRQWMKDHGQQNKPLVVSEYGVLYTNDLLGFADNDPQAVQNFMIGTFNYFLNTRDCNLGLPADDCRFVQRWNWYSLDDVGGTFNPYGRLFEPQSLLITDTGEAFRAFSMQYMDVLSETGY